jgi:hypothetical protein
VTWEVLSALAWSLAEQGREEAVSVASRALEVSRATRLPDSMAVAAVPVAITRAAAGDGAGVRDVLIEIQAISEMALSPEYAPRLPALARAAIAVGDVDLGASLARDVRPLLPIGEHALVTVTAQLAQARGDHAGAVAAFSDAVARWHGFGNQLEEAYAQLGLGRSLLRLADVRAATASLRTASELFVGMGARAPLATCQRLLAEAAGSDPGSRVTA